VLWATDEFGFLGLDDAWSTGSSMMPQKKNPDIAELVRGKSGRLVGHLTGLLTTLKGLPLAYNRDLQEDKEPLFDAVDQTRLGLGALTGLVASSTFRIERMQEAAASPTMAATDLAEILVGKGIPFREAHGIVGALVRRSLDDGLDLAALVAAEPTLGPDAARVFEPGAAVARRTSPGGAGLASVADQLVRMGDALAEVRSWLATA
jgi:argininosuccinate lyase